MEAAEKQMLQKLIESEAPAIKDKILRAYGILTNCAILPENEFFDFDAKYKGQVQEITPARISASLTERVQKLTSAIYDILGCKGIVRIDYIISQGDVINLLEVNTTPGMTATSFIPQQVRAAGLDIKNVMNDIIENELN